MAATGLCLGLSSTASALDGGNPLQITTLNGWDAFEIVTQLDNISAITDPGYGNIASRGTYDGLGGFVDGDELSILINHEVNSAAISRVQLDLPSFQQAIQSTVDGGTTAFPSSFVTRMGYGYDRIFDGTYHAVNNPDPVAEGTLGVASYGNSNFDRFCSGTSYEPGAFGTDRGFVDPIYITGEEVNGGKFYAIDPATDSMWEIPDAGLGRWENAAQVDTGNTTHTAMLLSPDDGFNPGDYLQLYVGEKDVDANGDGSIDFLERNGLRGGTVYYFDPDGAASTIDLPDGTVTGIWSTSPIGALQETKLEDIHTNPHNGLQVLLADQTDGLYTVDMTLPFSGGVFDHAASTAVITQIDDDDVAPIGAPDNVTWSADGKIYVQEDGDGDDIWQLNPDGTGIVQIASSFSEPSGIFDASYLVGYEPGSVFLSSAQGSGSVGGQLTVLISPDAALTGDLNGDGFVGLDDLDLILSNWNLSVPPGNPAADVNGDGFVGLDDLDVVLNSWNVGTPPSLPGTTIPEPAGLTTIALLGLLYTQRRVIV